MKEEFQSIRFRPDTLKMIVRIQAAVAEVRALGLKMTLRQLYYALVGAGVIGNNLREYKRIGHYVSDARMAGLIDWDDIEDRTRGVERLPSWRSPLEILQACVHSYRIDKWEKQSNHVEVWVEKEALSSVVAHACAPLEVPWMACRGYASITALYDAGQRISRAGGAGKDVVVIYLGDHDPSGMDMPRDLADRLGVLARKPVAIRRIALTMAQIHEYNAPPFPAKEKDNRAAAYRAQFGERSWELDALPVQALVRLISETVSEYVDHGTWAQAAAREQAERQQLRAAAESFEGGALRAQRPLDN